MSEKIDPEEFLNMREQFLIVSNFEKKCKSRVRSIVKCLNPECYEYIQFSGDLLDKENGAGYIYYHYDTGDGFFNYNIMSIIDNKELNLGYSFPKRWLFEDFEKELAKGLEDYLCLQKQRLDQKKIAANELLNSLNLSEDQKQELKLALIGRF